MQGLDGKYKLVDALDIAILRELCGNGRITASELAKKTGCSKPTALKKLSELKTRLDLHFTIEPNPEHLGFPYRYLVAAKTEKGIERTELLGLLKKSRVPQFAAICEGEFNLLIYAVTATKEEFHRWAYSMRCSLQASNANVQFWAVSDVIFDRLGEFGLSNNRLESIPTTWASKRDSWLLRELNTNCRVRFNELARKAGVTPNSIKYALERLTREDVIRRFTTIIQKGVNGVPVAFFTQKPFLADHPDRARRVRELYFEEEIDRIANRYQMVSELSGHFDQFNLAFFNSIQEWFKEKGITEELMGKAGTTITSAIIVDVLLGELPLRNLHLKEVYDSTEWTKETGWDGTTRQ